MLISTCLPRTLTRAGLLLAIIMIVPAPAVAQRAPVFLEPGHWAWDAARRLSAAGLAQPASDPREAPITIRHAHAVFRHAVSAADSAGRRGLADLARGYRQMLEAEVDSSGILTGVRLGAGWTASRGEALGGRGFFPDQDWVGAIPLRSSNHPALELQAHGYLKPWLSWRLRSGYLADQWVVPTATLGAAVGAFDLWGGRRRLHYGAGRGGAIVAGSGVNDIPAFAHRTLDTFEGAGIHVREPFHFPWILRFLGPSRVEVVYGRISRNGRVESPNVVFGRLTTTPFSDRLMIGVNRGAVFGGKDNGVSPRKLLGLLVGLHNEGFEDQVISAVLRYRPPLGALPLEIYTEFGADDTAGALDDVPTYIAGFDLAAVPGLTALAISLEHTRYSGSCCGNPPWYRNVFFRGSWSDEGRLFGHALGGHGYEWLGHARLDLPDRGVMVRGEAFARWRGHENLFAPERAGSSIGGVLSLEVRRGRSMLRLDGGYEDAASWSQHRVSAIFSHRFR